MLYGRQYSVQWASSELRVFISRTTTSVEMSTSSCSANQQVPVKTLPIGYLASYVTELTGCGRPSSPWLIDVAAGQTIHVTLFDFASERQLPSGPEQSTSLCPVYAIITDLGEDTNRQHRNMKVCGGGRTRERHVYSSLTNRITVGIKTDEHGVDTEHLPYFILKYEGESFISNVNPLRTRVIEYEK